MFTKIIEIVKHSIAWGREVANGPMGTASSSRVVILMVSTTVVGVLIAHVWMNHGLPAADQMYGLSAILATGAGAYATNKIRSDSRGQELPPPPPPPQGVQ